MEKPKDSIIQVAVVEDNYPHFELVKSVCEYHLPFKVELTYFENGINLLDSIQTNASHPFAFFLIDLKSPVMNGREILKKLRSTPASARSSCIIFSSSDDKDDVRECFEAGANAYVVKPIDFESFEQAIQCIFKFWGQVNLSPTP